MQRHTDTLASPWFEELEAAVRNLSRDRARDALRLVASFGLLPGAPVEGEQLSRTAIDGPLPAGGKA